jgi:hypothetical protein
MNTEPTTTDTRWSTRKRVGFAVGGILIAAMIGSSCGGDDATEATAEPAMDGTIETAFPCDAPEEVWQHSGDGPQCVTIASLQEPPEVIEVTAEPQVITETVEVEVPAETITETVEVEVVPDACIDALSAGEALLYEFINYTDIVSVAFEAASNFDVDGLNAAAADIEAATPTTTMAAADWRASSDACRDAA